jgi:hypothetical protein
MGLDMYAYVGRKGQHQEFYDQEDLVFDSEKGEYVSPAGGVTKPVEIAYWRKHPNLHGWMEQLWIRKTNQAGGVIVENPEWGSSFNGVELELTWEDLDELETAVKKRQLPATTGFFFGNNADQEYYQQDLEFIKTAKAETFMGMSVFYNSSW